MPKKAKSKAQARFLGFVAGGGKTDSGLSASKAKEMLRGTKHDELPERSKKDEALSLTTLYGLSEHEEPDGDEGCLEEIPGGEAEGMSPDDFDQDQLMRGIHHELEHTDSIATAMEIAMDHLVEDPEYYDKQDIGKGVPLDNDGDTEITAVEYG